MTFPMVRSSSSTSTGRRASPSATRCSSSSTSTRPGCSRCSRERRGVRGVPRHPRSGLGFGLFDTTSTAWHADWPLVEAAGATVEQTAAAYLAALADEGAALGGTTSLVDTPGFSDAAVTEPLLAQLARQAVNRARAGSASRTTLAIALDNLATRDPEELTVLLRQSLGTVSYRLDAWYTAVATSALGAMRASTAEGCHLGGYAWVENIERGAESETEGFIQAPSLNHAITAAILRSGWKAHGDAQPSSALAVDLSSARVRTAAELLDGVRGGVSLGDLMGHRIERALHDAFLDSWIEPCRRAVLDATGRAAEAAVAPVDGLVLAGLWAHGVGERAGRGDRPGGLDHRPAAGPRRGHRRRHRRHHR